MQFAEILSQVSCRHLSGCLLQIDASSRRSQPHISNNEAGLEVLGMVPYSVEDAMYRL